MAFKSESYSVDLLSEEGVIPLKKLQNLYLMLVFWVCSLGNPIYLEDL